MNYYFNMKYNNEELRYFIPQRILNKSPLTISGVDLTNELKTVKIYSEKTIEDILSIKPELLANNTRENILYLVSFSEIDNSSSLITAGEDKILFCQSFVYGGYVNILKLEHKKVFDSKDKSLMLSYVSEYLKESPHVSIKHSILCENEGDKYLLSDDSDFDDVKSGLFEYITYPCLSIEKVGIEQFSPICSSIVILSGQKEIKCTERISITEQNPVISQSSEREEGKLRGFERYIKDNA